MEDLIFLFLEASLSESEYWFSPSVMSSGLSSPDSDRERDSAMNLDSTRTIWVDYVDSLA